MRLKNTGEPFLAQRLNEARRVTTLEAVSLCLSAVVSLPRLKNKKECADGGVRTGDADEGGGGE